MKKVLATMLTVLIIAGTALTAFAASTNFVPSIAQKSVPTLVSASYASATAQSVDVAGDVIVTPYKDKDTAATDIKTALEAAYAEIAALKNVSKINTKADLNAAAAALKDGYTAKDLVVADLFDVTLTGTYKDQLANEGNTLTVTMETGYGADATNPIVLYRCANSGEWKMIDASNVVKVSDGKYAVTFSELCAVIFLKPATEVGVDPAQTGDTVNTVLWVSLAAVSCIGIAIVLPVMFKKKEA